MTKMCFVISPMGTRGSRTRIRADQVLETYIRPACREAGYEAHRGDQTLGQNIVKRATTALQNAPMAVAYMGPEEASCKGPVSWNSNVMIEIGYRLASNLPLIFLCDQTAEGDLPKLPVNLGALDVIPLPSPDNTNANWVDRHAQETINVLVRQIQAQERGRWPLSSLHAVASINASDRQDTSAENLYYTAASDAADDLFGIQRENGRNRRLAGLAMDQFLKEVEKRMHPAQWRAFDRDQRAARCRLAAGRSIAKVPIVFEKHEDDTYNHRAFLPIITHEYRPVSDGQDWYSLRVLYLDVTSATKKTSKNGEEYYVCELDTTSDDRLEPLKPAERGIRVFLSYRSENRARVQGVYNRLNHMTPYVEPFMDTCLMGGDNWAEKLGEKIRTSDMCFLFVDDHDIGNGQMTEVNEIQARLFSPAGRNYPVVPVILQSSGLPPVLPNFVATKQWVNFERLTDQELGRLLSSHFPNRCPQHWGSPQAA